MAAVMLFQQRRCSYIALTRNSIAFIVFNLLAVWSAELSLYFIFRCIPSLFRGARNNFNGKVKIWKIDRDDESLSALHYARTIESPRIQRDSEQLTFIRVAISNIHSLFSVHSAHTVHTTKNTPQCVCAVLKKSLSNR